MSVIAPRRMESEPNTLTTEDWCAVAVGLLLVVAGAIAFRCGLSLDVLAVVPRPWSGYADLLAQVGGDLPRYGTLAATLLILFTASAVALGLRPLRFAAGFVVLMLLAILTLAIGAWPPVQRIALEPLLIALLLGMVLGNAIRLPVWIKESLRAELYIKTGIVLLGATLPLPLMRLAGPVAIIQASVVSIVTFLTIFGVARFLEVDRRLAALLAAGGSVCGVSAVIAVAGAVRAKREHVSIATITTVAWSLVMIVLLPLLARAWYLPAGPAGAWIGASEFADAPGFAAVQVYNGLLRSGTLAGTPDQTVWAYTLVKVIGRDTWIGLWAAVLSFQAVLRWEKTEGYATDLSQAWRRFPKFILGFVAASIVVAWTDDTANLAAFNAVVRPRLTDPLDGLRNLMFTFSFVSIGASIRLRSMLPVGADAFVAFASGVVVNLVLGFLLSAVVFQGYWIGIAR
ncbi:MAG TPA: putative sulfate exporter family transporter [Rhodopila sp.]|uniref:YeiH family protein n=1 Tax=Rhodopila sp. TaxID=2480087 RepID=UPI002C7555BB|nr:putative sulfate exporter family transporter [Rhodopila sp.]HVY14251.1 putative sulfate exporter family transporter [Rhodopila sp.]